MTAAVIPFPEQPDPDPDPTTTIRDAGVYTFERSQPSLDEVRRILAPAREAIAQAKAQTQEQQHTARRQEMHAVDNQGDTES